MKMFIQKKWYFMFASAYRGLVELFATDSHSFPVFILLFYALGLRLSSKEPINSIICLVILFEKWCEYLLLRCEQTNFESKSWIS